MAVSPATADRRDLPVLALGFRPFYLVAAGFGMLAVPAWLLMYAGIIPKMPGPSGVVWHIHEMLFGFAPAVMAGFLLTAVRNWTGEPTPTGTTLGSLVVLWIAARVLFLTGPAPFAALVDLVFLPALGLAIFLPIRRSRNTRNYKVFGIIVTLALLNAAFHLAYLNYVPAMWLPAAYKTALDVFALLITVMAGRVIPAFTANANPGVKPRRSVAVEAGAVGSIIAIAALDLAGSWWQAPKAVWLALLVAAAIVHAARLACWAPLSTRRNLLLLMLPLAYAWLPVYFSLRALAVLGLTPPAAATHSLTIGAMAGLMVAMMMRSALGHTGRALRAGQAEVAAFGFLLLAAIVRVVVAAIVPEWSFHGALASGALWTAGFAVLFFAYWPVLTRPRVDGRPG
jgi:uncharacterized protein involved in response to NO